MTQLAGYHKDDTARAAAYAELFSQLERQNYSFTEIIARIPESLWPPPVSEDNEPPKPAEHGKPKQAARKRRRKPSLASVLKRADEAGIAVAIFTVNVDGSVTVVLGQPDESNNNPWDEVLP